MIQIDHLTFQYSTSLIPVFSDFGWCVEKGEAWAIIGPSGCGKTTLLYLLAGLFKPLSGEISIDYQRITRPRPKSGLILQDYGLLPWATVEENSHLGLKIQKYYGADGIHAPREISQVEKPNYWLEKFGLAEVKDKYPAQLSGGQRQRAAIARTLNISPDLLMMDEPFASLDIVTRETMQDLILSLIKENNITMLLVTHSIDEALFLGKKILLLNKPPNNKLTIQENPFWGFREKKRTHKYDSIKEKLTILLGENY